ncbi:sensor histidine kinase [Clostridium sp.]|uniref:sensor histidine kinase n=1 Tax=Clostridium sp. TaxID=1506 RepID=UPI003463B73F
MKRNYDLIVNNVKDIGNIDEDNLNLINQSSRLNVEVFVKGEERLYITDSEYKDNYTVNFLFSIGNGAYFEDAKNINSINNTTDMFNINYVYERDIELPSGQVTVKVWDNLSENLEKIPIFIMGITILEIISILASMIKLSKGSKKILKPIDEMNSTVKDITINKIHTRLNISGSQNELKDLALTFNEMLDRIQKSYESQNQFVSDASHELRTPISVIQGYIRLLDRWGKEDKDVLDESIEAIKSETENMKDLVEKLLFLARGDKYTQKVNKETFNLKILIDEVVKETKLIDDNHNINCYENQDVEIFADYKLLKEALRIFVDNSIKYTKPSGSITIGSYSSETQAHINIEDTGIGIAPEDLPNIFNRFYRADKSRTKDTGGTGLGLAIAKWIVMEHRGSIDVISGVNKGTKITINLPLKK